LANEEIANCRQNRSHCFFLLYWLILGTFSLNVSFGLALCPFASPKYFGKESQEYRHRSTKKKKNESHLLFGCYLGRQQQQQQQQQEPVCELIKPINSARLDGLRGAI